MSLKTNEVITYLSRCRCCLDYGYWKNMWGEYYWKGEKEIYVQMLKHCFSLSWEPQDLSKEQDQICESCVLKLREANQFKKTVLDSQLKLMEHLEDASSLYESYSTSDNPDDPDCVDDSQDMDYEEVEFLEEEKEQEIERTLQEYEPNKNDDEKPKTKKGKGLNGKRDTKTEIMSLLKEPISLDNIQWKTQVDDIQSSVTTNMKTVQGFISAPSKKRVKNIEHFGQQQLWKQNALVIFENSYVYPFIHSLNKYKCFICSKSFLDARFLEQHTNKHNNNEMKKELMRVQDLKVDVTNLKCKICFQTTSDLQQLKNHLKDHGKNIEPNVQDNIIPFKLGGVRFNCQICNEPYLKLRLLIIHMSKHFNNYSCEICGAVFISSNLLKHHQQIHVSGCFPCDKCDKVFSNATKRTAHTRGVHLKQFPRRCPICPQRFNSNYQRTKHLRIAHNQTTGLYRCDTCGREYDLKYHLSIHIRSVHLQERNQECPVCHSRFFSKYRLSRHMVIHTGEKNYKCEVCGKAYSRRNNLREHSKTHDDGF